MLSYFTSSNSNSDDASKKTITEAQQPSSDLSNPVSMDQGGANGKTRDSERIYDRSSDDSNAPNATAPGSWNEAHDLYCAKYGTIKATIQQLLTEYSNQNNEIPWEIPRRNNAEVTVNAIEVAEFLRTKRGRNTIQTASSKTPLKTSTASWLMSPLKVVSAVASMMRDPDDDYDEWVQEGDDAFVEDSDDCGAIDQYALGVNTEIVNLKRAESAVKSLEFEIGSIPPGEPCVMGLSEWNKWANSALTQHHATGSFGFSAHDNDFLLQVLVALKKAKVIARRKPNVPDVVVLSSENITDGSDEIIPENLRVHLALWDIQQAEDQIERKLQEWSEQAQLCTQKAIAYKKKRQIKLATIQIAKRRVIQQRIDSDSNLQIQLLQTKNAIESAQSNKTIVDIMADSAQLLRKLREDTPLEEVDEVVDDLQSELDDLKEMNDTIATIGGPASEEDDDELLKELEKLSLKNETVPEHVKATEVDNETTKFHPETTNIPDEPLPEVESLEPELA